MDEDTFNLSIRRFLKSVGIGSQREIEHAVSAALAAGSISGAQSMPVKMTLEMAAVNLRISFEGRIDLQDGAEA